MRNLHISNSFIIDLLRISNYSAFTSFCRQGPTWTDVNIRVFLQNRSLRFENTTDQMISTTFSTFTRLGMYRPNTWKLLTTDTHGVIQLHGQPTRCSQNELAVPGRTTTVTNCIAFSSTGKMEKVSVWNCQLKLGPCTKVSLHEWQLRLRRSVRNLSFRRCPSMLSACKEVSLFMWWKQSEFPNRP